MWLMTIFTSVAKPTLRIRREECIPDPSNMWGTWAPIIQCNASCGGGIQKIQRTCLCRSSKYYTYIELHFCYFGNGIMAY